MQWVWEGPARIREGLAASGVGVSETRSIWPVYAVIRYGQERWSGIFDRFAAPLSFGMGFMSGGGFQVLVGGIMGLSGRQQPMR